MPDVGPINHTSTFGEGALDEVAATELLNFEARVRGLTATGGGDYPEYSLAAMLAVMSYSFIDQYGELFRPMDYNSELVVITDAPSLQEELEETVTRRAKEQGVSIHFILSDNHYEGYGVYTSQRNRRHRLQRS